MGRTLVSAPMLAALSSTIAVLEGTGVVTDANLSMDKAVQSA